MKTWLKVAEAAEYASVSRDTIYTACERNSLRHARVGGRRTIRIKPESVDEWVERYSRGADHARTKAHMAALFERLRKEETGD